ncbi:hypothetical protein Pth03_08220 [Planotetraspora thailandica]|uniref:histidine kinase n=1 Tax=Planotetraspora thailandica TaxID=487172 RepID=A0A8J3UWA4_9ACTN|nr:sensor histidine kinase [Planotetraspora thailandica]GII52433.1 hypothetical protein Pth03_08220 [Planotetraspora thailandica]
MDLFSSEIVTRVTTIGVSVAFAGAGLVAVRVRPRNRVGPLMIVVGVVWLLSKLAPPPAGTALAAVWAGVLAHLIVAFPTGRLGGPAQRAVVVVAYLSAAVVSALALTDQASATVRGVATFASVLIGCAVLGLQVIRWRGSTVAQRRALGPVLAAAVVAVTLFVTLKPAVIAGVAAQHLTPVVHVALAAVPLGYLAALLRRRADRGRVAELVVHLTHTFPPVTIRQALAETLHDPALEVGYWTPESARYVNVEGQAVSDEGDRVATRIDHNGAPLALLLHDPVLLDDPELLEATCAAAALALSNERLTADLRARLRQLADSRSQVLRAAETERRRLERDLHDGVQQRLLSIPMSLGLAESALPTHPERARELVGEAKATTLAVLGELRALSQGIHPPTLTERGLDGAVRELVALAPVPVRLSLEISTPVPDEIETTAYYVVAEALANINKHADARCAHVRVGQEGGHLLVEVCDDGRGGARPTDGSGLRGLADRVAAAGGTFSLESPPGEGTRIRAVLPCR